MQTQSVCPVDGATGRYNASKALNSTETLVTAAYHITLAYFRLEIEKLGG